MQLRLSVAFASLVLLAGCTTPADDSPDLPAAPLPPDASSYAISLSDFPLAPLQPGQAFQFNSSVSGDAQRTSDHIGAHFGANSTTQPSATVYSSACIHASGTLPGRYTVSCTAPTTTGTYYLRGHARIAQDNVTTNWWSAETTFTVA